MRTPFDSQTVRKLSGTSLLVRPAFSCTTFPPHLFPTPTTVGSVGWAKNREKTSMITSIAFPCRCLSINCTWPEDRYFTHFVYMKIHRTSIEERLHRTGIADGRYTVSHHRGSTVIPFSFSYQYMYTLKNLDHFALQQNANR